MGWKASCIFASTPDAPPLTTFPPHQPARAKQLLSLLGGSYASRGMTTLEEGIYPKDGDQLYVGAYDQALVIGSTSIVQDSFHGGVPWIVDHARALLPDARVLIVTLHSVVDLFGYAWFENGQFVRGRAGAGDEGDFFDQGDLLPMERKLLDSDPESGGETIVMELCGPFIGCRLDEFSIWDLQMEHFAKTW
jgi:hypothetical protein